MIQQTDKAKRLIVIGAVHVDDIAHPEDTLIPLASNPVRWSAHVGGVAANAACAASRVLQDTTPTEVHFFAAVGGDATAKLLEDSLQSSGVSTHFERFKDCQTGRYSAIMTHDGELYIGLADVSLAERLGESAPPAKSHYSGANAALIDANISHACISAVVQEASAAAVPLAAMSVSPVKTQRLVPVANKIALLFCNRREAQAMLPLLPIDADLNRLADGLQQIGFERFVLTDGAAPLLIQDLKDRITLSVSKTASTQSVNGAGDALAGASFAAWSIGYSLADAVKLFGLEQASRVVHGLTTASSIHSASPR